MASFLVLPGDTCALSHRPARCVTKEGAAFRELRMSTGRPKIVPEEAKMVEKTAVPPRAGDTEEEGYGKEARAGTAQPAAGVSHRVLKGHSVSKPWCSGKSACF